MWDVTPDGPMRFGSLFAGVGGFDLGFERAGMTCAWQAEIDPKAQAVLRRRFPHAHLYDDVRKVDGSAERVDVVCGGFPCQDLSVAGRRAGLDGERSGLWWEFHRILAEVRPTWCVIENVPGLLSSNGGRDMGAVLGGLADLGYGFAYRVLDAQYLGVAQRRRRVFVVGRLGEGASPAAVLLEPESCGRDSAPRREAWAGAAGGVAACLNSGGNTGGFRTEPGEHLIPFDTTQITSALNRSQPRAGDPCHPLAAGAHPPAIAFSSKDYGADATTDLAPTLRAMGHDKSWANGGGQVAIAFHQTQEPIHGDDFSPALGATSIGMGVAYPVAVRGREDGQEWEQGDEPVYNALRAGDGGSSRANWMTDGAAVRRLTPTECERLQGFPDGWTDSQPDSARYRQLGNAVCVSVSEWIARRIVSVASSLAEEAAA